MADESRDRLERHYEALLKSYGDVMIAQAATDRTIDERTRAGNERAERLQAAVTKLDDEKADVATVDDVVTELRYIRKLLVGLLISICLACLTFAFAAIEIAVRHG
jgi:hypothetical protein